MARAPIGLKIKKQRKQVGITQAQLAERLGISGSYLNLIENNKRAIGGKLLQRISQELGLDVGSLDGESDRRLIMDLNELTTDPLFQNMDLTHATAPNLVGQHPRWAQALKILYRTYLDQEQTIKALSERLNYAPYIDDAIFQMLTNATAIRSSSEILGTARNIGDEDRERFLSILSEESQKLAGVAEGLGNFLDNAKVQTRSLTPGEEVDDFVMDYQGFFPNLENAAADLLADADFHGGDTERVIQDFLEKKFDVKITFSKDRELRFLGKLHQCSYDPATRILSVPSYASALTRRYEMACLLVELSLSDLISDEIRKSDFLISQAAQELAAIALISYCARALLMPYDGFLEDAVRERYDVDILSRKYTVSFLQASSRLASLRKPQSEGIPFALMHINPAGRIIKRLTLPRLAIPRHGNACPLWDIYSSFQTPGRIVRQITRFPNKERFLFFAKAEASDQHGYSQPRVLKATMLACDALHAEQTVYADGLDMGSEKLSDRVGVSCRLCSWQDCAHREEAPILS